MPPPGNVPPSVPPTGAGCNRTLFDAIERKNPAGAGFLMLLRTVLLSSGCSIGAEERTQTTARKRAARGFPVSSFSICPQMCPHLSPGRLIPDAGALRPPRPPVGCNSLQHGTPEPRNTTSPQGGARRGERGGIDAGAGLPELMSPGDAPSRGTPPGRIAAQPARRRAPWRARGHRCWCRPARAGEPRRRPEPRNTTKGARARRARCPVASGNVQSLPLVRNVYTERRRPLRLKSRSTMLSHNI